MFSLGSCRIISTGVMLPKTVITSAELMESINSQGNYGVNPKWLERTTGIVERRCADPDTQPSDMAVAAAKQAMDSAKILPSDIDMIIYAGVMRDHVLEPGTAHIVQSKLDAKGAIALDLNNACMGFMTALHVMNAFFVAGQVSIGMIVTGELSSRFSEKTITELKKGGSREKFDRLAAVLTLGDAGAAMIVGPKGNAKTGFVGFQMQSEGSHSDLCYCGDSLEPGVLNTQMTKIISAADDVITKTFSECMGRNLLWRADNIDHFIGHQVGLGTHRIYTRSLGLPDEKITKTYPKFGNLVTATIPVNLHLYRDQFAYGNKVYIAGAGSGICTGHAGLIWDQDQPMALAA